MYGSLAYRFTQNLRKLYRTGKLQIFVTLISWFFGLAIFK